MNSHSIVYCIIAAVNLVTAMSGAFAGDELNGTVARAATEFQVYHLVQSSPAEARRMLNELLGAEAKNAQLVADVENSDLLVSGSPAVQQLAGTLVQQINAADTGGRAEKSPVQSIRRTPQLLPDAWTNADPSQTSTLGRNASRQEFATRHAGVTTATDHAVRIRFRNISIGQAEQGLLRLLGPKILELSPHRLSCSIGRSRQVTMSFEEISQSCLL